jgi:hypothetical protein
LEFIGAHFWYDPLLCYRSPDRNEDAHGQMISGERKYVVTGIGGWFIETRESILVADRESRSIGVWAYETKPKNPG